MRLDRFSNRNFERGASAFTEALWLLLAGLLVSTWLPGSRWRATILRAFGAAIGTGVVLKPGLRVKFPWRLSIGDHSWIGENAWIDNLASVVIDSHVCVSQGAYLCTGSHDWARDTFDLIARPITIESHVWIGAMARVGPGVTARQGAVLALAGFAKGDLEAWTIYAGNPATPVRTRRSAPAEVATPAAAS